MNKALDITPVILCGGSGTRLWPLSRRQLPKQYLTLYGNNTMLQETILRLKGLSNLADPIIVCNVDHRFLVAEQCHQIDIKKPTILLEPVGRNTGPAIAAAAIQSLKQKNNSVLLVLSADHIIKNVDAFYQAINVANQQAQKGKLITFGIVPTNANTGYGYIRSSKKNIDGAYKVQEFVEKPNEENAKKYLELGNYLWNSGIFMFKPDLFVDELNIFSSDTVKLVADAINNAKQDLDFIRLEKKAFESCSSNSIDCMLMEKSKKLVVVPLNAGWSDVGSWSTLYDISEKDSSGNVLKGDITVKDTTNTYIFSDDRMIAAVGLDNLVIIDTPDVTFIASQDKAHEVNSIVESLKNNNRNEVHFNSQVFRPWGWYESIQSTPYFQVKRLNIKPGGKLSLQLHYKRSEYWVVVRGIATVINGEKKLTLMTGESTYVPLESIHSLANNTKEVLEVIEVQSGSYLGEDDIVRFEDIYGRID